ncbi:MAG: phage holin family protein [Actinomycetota bacterium]|nr:phage holin family protein [Actinomycetota bacterium]
MPASNDQSESLATTVSEVSERMSVLVREEIELAKAEVTVKVSSLARGAAALAAGAVFGVFALVIALFTLAWGLNSLFASVWLGFAVTLVILLVLTGAAFMLALRKLKVGAPTPNMAIDEAKKIRETVSARAETGS